MNYKAYKLIEELLCHLMNIVSFSVISSFCSIFVTGNKFLSCRFIKEENPLQRSRKTYIM